MSARPTPKGVEPVSAATVRQKWWPRVHLFIVLAVLIVIALAVVYFGRMLQRQIANISVPL